MLHTIELKGPVSVKYGGPPGIACLQRLSMELFVFQGDKSA